MRDGGVVGWLGMGEPRPALRFEACGAAVGGDCAVAVDELGEEGVHRRARDGLDALQLARLPGPETTVWLLRALRAHTKAPYKTDLHRKTLRSLKRPGGPGQNSRMIAVALAVGR